MESFQMFLNEIFNQPYKIKMVKKTENEVHYTFTTSDNKKGLIIFNRITPRLKSEYWEFDFAINMKYGLTGGGESFTILATVLEACKDFLKNVDAKIIKFSADKTPNDSRSSLYSTMVKKFARVYGFDFEEKEFPSGTSYTLTKTS